MLPIFNISLIGLVDTRRRAWFERAFMLIAETDARSVGDSHPLLVFTTMD